MPRCIRLSPYLCFISALSVANCLSDRERVLYTDVTPVNTTHCLEVIENIPLRQYIFKYDRSGRGAQVGVIGEEVQSLLPQAVDVVASRTFPNPEKGKPPVVVENLAVVDKNVLFMTNVGAVQRLLEREEEISARLSALSASLREQDRALQAIRDRVADLKEQEGRELLRVSEMEVERARKVAELERVALEEEARTLEEQARQEKEYGSFLESQEKAKAERQSELEMARTLETMKAREAMEKEREDAKLRRELELKDKELSQVSELERVKREGEVARVKAEAEAKAEAERRLEEMQLKRIHVKAEEDRRRALEIIHLVMAKLGSGARALLDQPKRLFLPCLLFILLVTCYYAVRETLSLVRHMIQSQIGRPRLVRETSRSSRGRWLGALAGRLWIRQRRAGREEVVSFFKDVVLPPDLRKQVHMLAVATRNAKANGAPYRHLLLHGPPGTGKTMVAKRLARSSAMDYAVMSGGDVGPLGKDAVTELHRLFQWAQTSSRGLLLFIDEAEAFLSARGAVDMSEGRRNALNALLYQTGQQSYNFMMVLATNRPQDLDSAVLDRMDDYLCFPLPSPAERASLLRLYYDSYIVQRKVKGYECLVETDFARAAKGLDGFSGREISKLMLSVVNSVYGSEDTQVSRALFDTVVKQKADEHQQKEQMGLQEDCKEPGSNRKA